MQSAPSDERADATDAAGLCARGAALHDEGRHEAAVAVLSEAIRLDPALVEARVRRGIAFDSQGQPEAAIADFSEAIRLDPHSAWALEWRGAALSQQGRISEALADHTEAIRLQPDDPNAYVNRGVAHHNGEDYDAALADYSAAIRLDPDNASAFLYRGRVRDRLHEHDEALADFTQAIRCDPTCATAFLYRGRIRQDEDETEAALADFTEAIRLDPGSAAAFRDRAEAWAEIGELDRAIADFTAAIRLAPRQPSAYAGRAEVWDELGEHEKADADFRTADQLSSERDETMPERKSLIHPLLQAHFEPASLDDLTITERRFPGRVRADLQRAIDSLLEQMTVCHFCGVRKQYAHEGVNFTELVVRDRNDPPLSVPPQYEEIDIGEAEPLRCLKTGLWLLEQGGSRFAVFLEPTYRRASVVRFQVATVNNEQGTRLTQTFFQHLEQAVQDARSYRGKILSLEEDDDYSGTASGIKVHTLRQVGRDQVILPRRTLELLERNVIQFVRQRPRLAELGLATKKGLLFYGPPGTGKTHTIHYLAGALDGMTTLLISAEQVGLLGEYMTLARLLQPSMVVIEDADLIARERTAMGSVCEEVLLNKLLNEMDGLKESADILFVLTTNRPEALEAALASRPGRIDQAIEFPFPDEEGRTKLARLYSRGVAVPEEVVRETVRRTENVSAAFIKELMRRATQFQLERDGSNGMVLADIQSALDELLFSGGSLNRKLLGGNMAQPAEALS